MRKADNFKTVELGTTYEMPKYRVIDGTGIREISELGDDDDNEQSSHYSIDQLVTRMSFVRGDKRTVTIDQFQEAIRQVNRLAPYIGVLSFMEEDNTFKDLKVKYTVAIGKNTEREYRKLYEDSVDVIKRYLNPITKVDGITHEQLLGVMIEDLQYKNSLIPSRESSLAITNLQQALMWLEERTRLREKAGILGIYNK